MTAIDVSLKGSVGALTLDATFCVPASGITCLRGASGSGKTTLLRAIAGLTRLSGHVRIADTVWQDGRAIVPVHKRRVGLVFQDASLFSHLSAQGNLDYALKRNGGAQVDTSALIDLLRLKTLLTRGVASLSGGEAQRVALARTLFSAPDVLLMDEPLSSLDVAAKAEILPLIKTVGQRLPVLYVTHDDAEVAEIADRVLRVEDGRVSPAPLPSLEDLSEAQVRALAAAALKAGLMA